MKSLNFLTWSIDGTIGTVQLDRPPVNAVNGEMYAEIEWLFTHIEDYMPGVRTVILTGAGKHFCGGNDLHEFQTMTPENAGERMFQVRKAFWAIYDCPAPVIAAVHGVAMGTGLALAASCDLVVADTTATFTLPEVNVGVMGGAKHASRLVPQQLVRYLHLTGETLPAATLAEHGGILTVVEPDELLGVAHEVASKIVRHSPVTLKFAKRSLNQIEYMNLKDGYEFEQGLSGELSGYSDAKEAISAFFERRSPVYTGE